MPHDNNPGLASEGPQETPALAEQVAILPPKELELLKGFIANQKGELELRQKELEIRADENKAASQFAHASLDAMAVDRKEERATSFKKLNSTYVFPE